MNEDKQFKGDLSRCQMTTSRACLACTFGNKHVFWKNKVVKEGQRELDTMKDKVTSQR